MSGDRTEARHHEGRDVRVRAVLFAVAAGLCAIVVLSGAAAGFMAWLAPPVETARIPPGTERPDDGATPGLREADLVALDAYSWVDRERGRVRIPIDAAMELLAERGWPAPDTGEAGP